MKITTRAANNFTITDAIKEHIELKVGSLAKFLPADEELEARVNIKIYDVIQKVEVTLPGKQFILRAEEEHTDLYAAVDLVIDKLERQIRRHKTKANKKIKEREGIAEYFINLENGEKDVSNGVPFKSKEIFLKPMDVEEAIMQLDLLGHDFYVYFDMEINAVCIVYRRKDGQIGVIETNRE
ncbi:MAG: ribosome-associated translation inhibitor RaiA [Defluviitaleaceae bacterium]|nr:ribosome-associated translation inhibitor RaiA [Defluviitaleaceae bacterium]